MPSVNREETDGRTALYYIINVVTSGSRLALPSVEELEADGLPAEAAAGLLQLTAACWSQLPVARPTMAEVAGRLGELVRGMRDARRAAAVRAVHAAATLRP